MVFTFPLLLTRTTQYILTKFSSKSRALDVILQFDFQFSDPTKRGLRELGPIADVAALKHDR